ncbi:hypothetical protein, partial [Streptococcus suis]
LFCPDGVVSALKQPFSLKTVKKTNTKTMFVCNLRTTFYEVVLLSCLRKEAVAGLKLYPWDIVLPRIKRKGNTNGIFYQSKQAALRHPEI